MYRNVVYESSKEQMRLFTWDEDGKRIVVTQSYNPYLYIEPKDNRHKTAESIYKSPLRKLVFKRDPSVVESLYYDKKYYPIDNTKDKADVDGLMDLVIEYPQAVAEMLREYGWTPMSLMEECQIDDMSHYYNYMDNYATRRYS